MGWSSLELHKKRTPVCLDWERFWPGWVVCPGNQWERGRWVGNIAGIVFEPRKTCLKALWELSRKRNNIRVIWDWETESKYQRRKKPSMGNMGKGEEKKQSILYPSDMPRYSWWRHPNFPSVGLSFLFCEWSAWIKQYLVSSSILNFCSQSRSRENVSTSVKSHHRPKPGLYWTHKTEGQCTCAGEGWGSGVRPG